MPNYTHEIIERKVFPDQIQVSVNFLPTVDGLNSFPRVYQCMTEEGKTETDHVNDLQAWIEQDIARLESSLAMSEKIALEVSKREEIKLAEGASLVVKARE